MNMERKVRETRRKTKAQEKRARREARGVASAGGTGRVSSGEKLPGAFPCQICGAS
jgi:hypothetical protein